MSVNQKICAERLLMRKKFTTDTQRLHYPTPVSGIQGLRFSLLFGLFITLFLWLFEPFDINTQNYTLAELLVFGGISFGVFFTAHSILPLFKPNIYKEKNWTIYSQIIFYVILTLVIASSNGLYINFRNNLNFSWNNYLLIITQTFAVGILPISVAVLLSYFFKYKKIAEQSAIINQQIKNNKPTKIRQYTLKSHVKKETVVIDEATFLFAKSSGNYVEVFVAEENPVILRMGLADLETQLSSDEKMLRCHRSYFVNTSQIDKVTGNAQGLKLWIKNTEFIVPVSRKYLEAVKTIFSNN